MREVMLETWTEGASTWRLRAEVEGDVASVYLERQVGQRRWWAYDSNGVTAKGLTPIMVTNIAEGEDVAALLGPRARETGRAAAAEYAQYNHRPKGLRVAKSGRGVLKVGRR